MKKIVHLLVFVAIGIIVGTLILLIGNHLIVHIIKARVTFGGEEGETGAVCDCSGWADVIGDCVLVAGNPDPACDCTTGGKLRQTRACIPAACDDESTCRPEGACLTC